MQQRVKVQLFQHPSTWLETHALEWTVRMMDFRQQRDKIIYGHEYEMTYEFDMDVSCSVHEVLDEVYAHFNEHHPLGFDSYSLSVDDVIRLGDTYYRVEALGFSEVKYCS